MHLDLGDDLNMLALSCQYFTSQVLSTQVPLAEDVACSCHDQLTNSCAPALLARAASSWAQCINPHATPNFEGM